MSKIVSFESEFGTIKVESPKQDDLGFGGTRSHNENEEKEGGKFQEAISTLRAVSGAVINEVRKIPKMPSEIEVKVGLKLSGGAGKLWEFVLASAQAEGALEVTLKWKDENH